MRSYLLAYGKALPLSQPDPMHSEMLVFKHDSDMFVGQIIDMSALILNA